MIYESFATIDVSWMESGGQGGFLDGITGLVQELGASIYALIFTVGIVCLFVAIISAGILYIAGSKTKKEETKEWSVRILVGGIIIFSVTGIVSAIGTVGSFINQELKDEVNGTVGVTGSLIWDTNMDSAEYDLQNVLGDAYAVSIS